MADIFDVAHYIVEQQGDMSTMKLQKLCYYSQSWNLVWEDKPLFPEDFKAWGNGPVNTDLFHMFKGKFNVSESMFGSEYKLTDLDKENINLVLEHYGDKDAHWLSELTHLEDPWIIARKGYNPGEICTVTITKESMHDYYSGL